MAKYNYYIINLEDADVVVGTDDQEVAEACMKQDNLLVLKGDPGIYYDVSGMAHEIPEAEPSDMPFLRRDTPDDDDEPDDTVYEESRQ